MRDCAEILGVFSFIVALISLILICVGVIAILGGNWDTTNWTRTYWTFTFLFVLYLSTSFVFWLMSTVKKPK